VHVDPDRVGVTVGGVPIVFGGAGVLGSEADARAALDRCEVEVAISLGLGEGSATVIASDLSPDYVEFNSARTS
jgi:glutamate N-acetyltransferase / amino-acid N-acetyltransferase